MGRLPTIPVQCCFLARKANRLPAVRTVSAQAPPRERAKRGGAMRGGNQWGQWARPSEAPILGGRFSAARRRQGRRQGRRRCTRPCMASWSSTRRHLRESGPRYAGGLRGAVSRAADQEDLDQEGRSLGKLPRKRAPPRRASPTGCPQRGVQTPNARPPTRPLPCWRTLAPTGRPARSADVSSSTPSWRILPALRGSRPLLNSPRTTARLRLLPPLMLRRSTLICYTPNWDFPESFWLSASSVYYR